jgi:hypothetical protein
MPNSKNRINEEDITPRNLKDIFKAISDIQQVELDDPSEEKSEEAFKWYEQFAIDSYQQITNSSQFDQRTKKQILTNSTSDFLSRSKRAGVLYTFIYQPETENLDYWDKFPLVLRMLDNSDSTESFLGINLHYLDPKRRWMILMNLMSHLSGPETDPNSRIIGLGMRKLKLPINRYSRVCIRRYKYDNIRGRALMIPPEHWIKMVFLPTYHFIGGKPAKVWKDSIKRIRKLGLGI